MKVIELEVHPTNLEIYGEPDTGLAENMEKFGQHESIRVNAKGQILSGARRWAAAASLGWEEIDAVIVEPEDEELYILLSNKYRDRKSDYIKKLEADRYYAKWQNGEREWADSGNVPEFAPPTEHVARAAGFPDSSTWQKANYLFNSTPREAKQAPHTSTAELDIDHAASEGLISKEQHKKLEKELAAQRAAVKRSEVGAQGAARKIKGRFQKAVTEYEHAQHKALLDAISEFWKVISKGRAFNQALSKLNTTAHIKHLNKEAALYLLATVWQAKAVLEDMAGAQNIRLQARNSDQLSTLNAESKVDVESRILESATQTRTVD